MILIAAIGWIVACGVFAMLLAERKFGEAGYTGWHKAIDDHMPLMISNAKLKAKLAELESEHASLKDEYVILKDDYFSLKAEFDATVSRMGEDNNQVLRDWYAADQALEAKIMHLTSRVEVLQNRLAGIHVASAPGK